MMGGFLRLMRCEVEADDIRITRHFHILEQTGAPAAQGGFDRPGGIGPGELNLVG